MPKKKTTALASRKPPPVLHLPTMAGSLYKHFAELIGGEKNNSLAELSSEFIMQMWFDFQKRKPDAIEQMAFIQLTLLYTRMCYLTLYSTQQSNVKASGMMHEGADRAANTYRKLMLALVEYRAGGRPRSLQATIAAQQLLIQSGNSENEKPTNEQGSSKALPAVPQGPALLAPNGGPREALALEHRPANGCGQVPIEQERMEARAEISRSRVGTGRSKSFARTPAKRAGRVT